MEAIIRINNMHSIIRIILMIPCTMRSLTALFGGRFMVLTSGYKPTRDISKCSIPLRAGLHAKCDPCITLLLGLRSRLIASLAYDLPCDRKRLCVTLAIDNVKFVLVVAVTHFLWRLQLSPSSH